MALYPTYSPSAGMGLLRFPSPLYPALLGVLLAQRTWALLTCVGADITILDSSNRLPTVLGTGHRPPPERDRAFVGLASSALSALRRGPHSALPEQLSIDRLHAADTPSRQSNCCARETPNVKPNRVGKRDPPLRLVASSIAHGKSNTISACVVSGLTTHRRVNIRPATPATASTPNQFNCHCAVFL